MTFTVREPRTLADEPVDLLEQAPEPMTTAAIGAAVGRHRTTVLPILSRLASAGCIRRIRGTHPTSPVHWEPVP